MLKKCFILTFSFLAVCLWGFETDINVNTIKGRSPISPYIFGANQMWGESYVESVSYWKSKRIGGNRTSTYNWENNASNAGADWYHSSDNFWSETLGLPASDYDVPGAAWKKFHEINLTNGAYSLVTVQMLDFVPADKEGSLTESDAAPSIRWNAVEITKGSPFSYPPDLEDGVVYMDEFVSCLVNQFGPASGPTGIKGYSLDNEPALWNHTHPYSHPQQTTVDELIAKSIEAAKAIKRIDPSAETFGPTLYGMSAFYSLQDSPDWHSKYAPQYRWFIDLYLEKMREASEEAGYRLLDVLDLHWYPEARGGGERVTSAFNDTEENAIARIQAPRTLWDIHYCLPTSHEDSWIANNSQWLNDFMPLLPKLQESIDTYYPGTKLALTEYQYGGEEHISGGLALVDALGIYADQEVYLANLWKQNIPGQDYVDSAFRLYLDYDGRGSEYGNTRVNSSTNACADSGVHASVDEITNKAHIILINRKLTEEMTANVTLTSDQQYSSAEVWGFDEYGIEISLKDQITGISNNSFSLTLSPASAVHIVLSGAQGILPGDVNNSNSVNIIDALMIAQYYVGLNPEGFVPGGADFNNDSVINIIDALMVARYYVGIE